MANTSAIWQQASHTTYKLSSPSCWTRAIQKSLTLNDKYLRLFWKKKSGEWTISRKNDKTERARGLGRKKTREIGKGNQMTALRFQTRGRHQTSTASLPGCELETGHLTHQNCRVYIYIYTHILSSQFWITKLHRHKQQCGYKKSSPWLASQPHNDPHSFKLTNN